MTPLLSRLAPSLRRVVSLVLTVAVAATGFVLLTSSDGESSAQAGWSRKAFPHRPHLSAETLAAALREGLAADRGEARPGGGGVVDKDCRACHDYAAHGPEHHVQRENSCDECHIGEEHLTIQYAPERRTERPVFPHAAHLNDPSITCFTCHRVGTTADFVEFSMPADGLGVRGVGGRPGGEFGDSTCADCHAEHEAEKGKRNIGLVAQDEITGDGRECADCHLSATSILPQAHRAGGGAAGAERRPFLHADHGGSSSDCESCHQKVADSASIWDYDPVADTSAACQECHVDASGNTLAVAGETVVMPKVSFSMFPHDQHVNVDGSVETTFEGTPTCADCHYEDKYRSELVPGPSEEPVSRAELIDYADCVDCHDTWRTDPHPPGACFKCHDMGKPLEADGMQPMAFAEVHRDVLGEAKFTQHHHPGITAEGMRRNPEFDGAEPNGQDCKDCHLGDIETLDSKLTGKRFDHDPHVPANAKSSDCLICHTTVVTAKRSSDLARFEPHLAGRPVPVGAGALAKACVECHVGAKPEDLGLSTVTETVPEFDHAAHIEGFDWKGGRGISCAECHQPGGETGYQTPADVLDCTSCHSHDADQPEKLARTGPIGGTEGEGTCNDCHATIDEFGQDLSMPDEAGRTRRKLVLSDGLQHHDKSGACAECHYRDASPDGRTWTYEPRIKTTDITGVSVHDRDRDAWYNDPSIRGGPADRSCRTCHYNEPDAFLRR